MAKISFVCYLHLNFEEVIQILAVHSTSTTIIRQFILLTFWTAKILLLHACKQVCTQKFTHSYTWTQRGMTQIFLTTRKILGKLKRENRHGKKKKKKSKWVFCQKASLASALEDFVSDLLSWCATGEMIVCLDLEKATDKVTYMWLLL